MTDGEGTVSIGRLGRIAAGEEVGRWVEVLDDGEKSGGFLIVTYADEHRSPEVFDAWVETMDQVASYFAQSGWRIDWLPE